MITGDLKNKVDSIWDTLWTGGITSPITVLEQITYLMFMKLLDDNQLKQEANANVLGVPLKEENKVFKCGKWIIEDDKGEEIDSVEYQKLRWSEFHVPSGSSAFVVLKGSEMSRTETNSCKQGTKKRRQKLIDVGAVEDYVFVKNVRFNSASSAAACVYGGSQNGKTMWANEAGQTLSELE